MTEREQKLALHLDFDGVCVKWPDPIPGPIPFKSLTRLVFKTFQSDLRKSSETPEYYEQQLRELLELKQVPANAILETIRHIGRVPYEDLYDAIGVFNAIFDRIEVISGRSHELYGLTLRQLLKSGVTVLNGSTDGVIYQAYQPEISSLGRQFIDGIKLNPGMSASSFKVAQVSQSLREDYSVYCIDDDIKAAIRMAEVDSSVHVLLMNNASNHEDLLRRNNISLPPNIYRVDSLTHAVGILSE
ncbi:hypothetical protein HY469_04775 [Candidatus Roizmanbacteria bacterium]|nr:hypothetical protein [Candidatus Roizmanbacteria bacterium]